MSLFFVLLQHTGINLLILLLRAFFFENRNNRIWMPSSLKNVTSFCEKMKSKFVLNLAANMIYIDRQKQNRSQKNICKTQLRSKTWNNSKNRLREHNYKVLRCFSAGFRATLATNTGCHRSVSPQTTQQFERNFSKVKQNKNTMS